MTTQTLGPADKQLWLAAAKPPMYGVAIMPICVGSAIAYAETGLFNLSVFATFLLAAVLLLVWENLSNDVFDAETGIDVNKHHSLVNLTRNRGLIFGLGNLCLALGIAGIVSISLWQRDLTVLGLVLLCCVLGYLYQGPPFRLGYHGLGEILCFLSFGPLAVEAAYYSQTQSQSAAAWVAAAVIGLTTTLVLFCSHFHQVEDDRAAGKRSPIVRLGTRRGAALLPWVCAVALGLVLVAIAIGWFSAWTALSLIGLLPAIALCRHVGRYHDQPARVSNAKFLAIRFHFCSGLLLCLGVLLPASL
ncbi:2-carboxy-1,4-naphthoquinone phytyltransferase [Romeria aff. gracilis LEGE 07310]|uniref:2-carboxy-1,4-naphthoquinone phytyltransferase n=1 Tax=Vasconcelosia minhoensis LEGE 07310 TaxID=915328 RepID=A0A8J7DNH2_9CYAN|nr:2-carboxy-1,4-naphthoquinone phytyltransferase [Romeria gracilis]MBE9078125.1 2-carboxy-1,4-naphthoquinone phytyltransferase [Romeria aff. gracilis LEGE 07310]